MDPVVLVAVTGGLHGMQQEAVHALHLVLDELHVAPDPAQKLGLLGEADVSRPSSDPTALCALPRIMSAISACWKHKNLGQFLN
jgi:hypothetical protein